MVHPGTGLSGLGDGGADCVRGERAVLPQEGSVQDRAEGLNLACASSNYLFMDFGSPFGRRLIERMSENRGEVLIPVYVDGRCRVNGVLRVFLAHPAEPG